VDERQVVVVGDTHGQFFDVLSMLKVTDAYQDDKYYIFNGTQTESLCRSLYLRIHCMTLLHKACWRQELLHPAWAKLRSRTAHGQSGKVLVAAGDIVDRGSWGVELFLAVAVMKLAVPSRVLLLRGNHESKLCTSLYGFKKELERKYPHKRRKVAGSGMQRVNMGSFLSAHHLSFRHCDATPCPACQFVGQHMAGL
jgi:hypothetical protein